jgi:kojibiose phosphorylase
MNTYQQRQWQIVETRLRPDDLLHTETIFTIGNGLVGVRGSFEEGYPNDNGLTLAAGIFNHKTGELVPELVAMPNWLALRFRINGQLFQMNTGTLLGFRRVLDLQTATLSRGVLWKSPTGEVIRFHFERFASLANPHVLVLRALVQVLSEGQHTLEIENALDGSVSNMGGINHWERLDGQVNSDTLRISGKTDQSGYEVAMHSRLVLENLSGDFREVSPSPRNPTHRLTLPVEQNQKILLTKYVSLHTTRDTSTPETAAQETLAEAVKAGYPFLKAAHESAWANYWKQSDVRIQGDEVAQRSIRFCLYHILIATPTVDERVSIGAKTLSGHGYKGHVFWDTELFMVPPLTLTQPELARRLLMYRYHNLAGARAKAQEAGYEGAMFPWESTDTGEETTPRWTNPDQYGERIRIWTGDNEQHISTDIAYAVWQFWQWTGDDEWFRQYGAEILLDTAKFWGSRAEYNPDQDRYELRQQIGPDEYHENIDNSVFTNRMVVWHLEQALSVWNWLTANHPADAERLGRTLEITEERLQKWRTIADKMWIPVDAERGVLEQFEGFFAKLHPLNLEDYTPRTKNMDWIMGHAKTQVTRVIKQADVVMLMALLGDDIGDQAFLRRNWDTYAEIVDHGSSLSPSIHAWVAARLGLIDRAYDDFIFSATMDLEDLKGNVRDGIHAASCGGVWQAVIFGFCGLELTPEGVRTHPRLPSHWREVSFQVWHHGKPLSITVKGNG